jgi:hypothetical protein
VQAGFGTEVKSYADDNSPDCFQHFHDFCLVWSSPVQGHSPVESDFHKLDNRLRGVLFPGARQPDGARAFFRRPAQDHTGNHYFHRFLPVFSNVSPRGDEVELHCGVRPDDWSQLFCFPQVVTGRAFRVLWHYIVIKKSVTKSSRRKIIANPKMSPDFVFSLVDG